MLLQIIYYISWFLFTLLVAGGISILVKYVYDRHSHFPPGPLWIPVIGTITRFTQDFHRNMKELSNYYGHVFQIYVAGTKIVFINDVEAAREVLVTRSADFASRPDDNFDILKYLRIHYEKQKYRGIADGLFNNEWKSQRKFSHQSLRSFGFGKSSFQDQIMLHVEDLLEMIQKHHGDVFSLDEYIGNSISNVICSIVFNQKYDFQDKDFKSLVEAVNVFFYEAGVIRKSPLSLFRILWPYFVKTSPHCQKFIKASVALTEFCQKQVDEHDKSLDEGNIRDFIDTYLLECKKQNTADAGFNKEQLAVIVQDLFLAGTETTSSTLLWAVLFMLRHPDVQDTVYQEISNVIDHQASPYVSWDDRDKLIYTEAVLMEVQRLGNVAPFTLPHVATCDTSVAGYKVLAGDTLFVNLYAIHTDPRVWKDPNTFNPNRFIDEEGKIKKMTGSFLPFSAGRRVCLGEQLAKMELLLFFGNLIYKFHLKPEKDGEAPEFDTKLGLTLQPQPYRFRAEMRE